MTSCPMVKRPKTRICLGRERLALCSLYSEREDFDMMHLTVSKKTALYLEEEVEPQGNRLFTSVNGACYEQMEVMNLVMVTTKQKQSNFDA